MLQFLLPVIKIESENHRIIGWKGPLRSSSPTTNPTPPCLLNPVPKGHIHTVFEPLQGWGLHHCPRQPGSRPDHSFSEEVFPNLQSEPPLMQLEAIASRPIAGYWGEETNPCLTTPSCQGVVESEKVSPQPPLLQTEQPQLPQLLLIRLVLQTPHQPRCPSLDTLQPLNVLLVVRGPELNTALKAQPHQCWVQGHHHLPAAAGHLGMVVLNGCDVCLKVYGSSLLAIT